MLRSYIFSGLSVPYRRLLAVIVPSVLVLACADSPSAPPPDPSLPPLPAGTWYVNKADGQALPAMIAHRLVNGVLEQTFLDSSSFTIDATGTWQQQIFKRRVLIGTPAGIAGAARLNSAGGTNAGSGDIHEPVADFGTWTATDSAYLFVSLARPRQFVIRAPTSDSLFAFQKLVDHAESGVMRSSFRRTPPLPSLVGLWRADRALGATLPALVESIPTLVDGTRVISWHVFLDSARVELRADGSYEHLTWVSGWEGNANGPPLTRGYGNKLIDRGVWTRAGVAFTLVSEYFEEHSLAGAVEAAGSFVLLHGVELKDPHPFPVMYKRQ